MKDFIKYLKRGSHCITADQKALEEFYRGKIKIKTLFNRMKANNNMPSDLDIDMKEFKVWVHSLGY